MTQRGLWWAGLLGALWVLGLVGGARPPAAARPAQGTPTVVVEPTVAPVPLILPRVLKRFDPRVPEAIETRFEGYVVKLTRDGRQACAPATHVLQTKREGYPGAEALTMLYSPRPGPNYNLDLYVGEWVEVSGFAGLSAPECRTLSWQLLSVETIRRIILPPGATR